MKTTLLLIMFLILFSLPLYSADSRTITIDLGSFSGFFGFGYEWLEGLAGHKVGFGVVDSNSIRLAYAYKRYFPDRDNREEVRPSRIFMGPLFNVTFEDIYTETLTRFRLGLQMGYELTWGSDGQYYSSLAGGFAVLYPPYTYSYYYPYDPPDPNDNRYVFRDAFRPVFTASFGYRY